MAGDNKSMRNILALTAVFVLVGFVHSLNVIFIPQLKGPYQFGTVGSIFINNIFFIGCLLVAYPAGLYASRVGYKKSIVTGLSLLASGLMLFCGAFTGNSTVLLLALSLIAGGLVLLETSTNTYVIMLSDSNGAVRRLNFAQAFTGLAGMLALIIGNGIHSFRYWMIDDHGQNIMQENWVGFSLKKIALVQIPYLSLGLLALVLALFIFKSALPEKATNAVPARNTNAGRRNLWHGIMANFFYVGAHVGVSGYFVYYAVNIAGINEKLAAMYLSAAVFVFMVGRFLGAFFMRYVSSSFLLFMYSLVSIALLLFAMFSSNLQGVYALVALHFFMSIMYPTIFSISLKVSQPQYKYVSSFLVMSLIGGAIVPLAMKWITEFVSFQLACAVPVCGLLFVSWFAYKSLSQEHFVMASKKVRIAAHQDAL
jgi:FHS family L-fucose permease-like MFS transporter